MRTVLAFIEDHCANCDVELPPRVEGLFCCDGCRQTAEWVRYYRRVAADGRIEDPLVKEALRTRMAFLVVGGYPETARRIPTNLREEVIRRDDGQCVLCGRPGSEIDHIDGNSNDPTNLRYLCSDCHHEITNSRMVPMSGEHLAIRDGIMARATALTPTRPCDDEHDWANRARRLKTERRSRLLELLDTFGFKRADFKGVSWPEMWDDVLNTGEFGDGSTGTVEDYEHGAYLRELAQRDD